MRSCAAIVLFGIFLTYNLERDDMALLALGRCILSLPVQFRASDKYLHPPPLLVGFVSRCGNSTCWGSVSIQFHQSNFGVFSFSLSHTLTSPTERYTHAYTMFAEGARGFVYYLAISSISCFPFLISEGTGKKTPRSRAQHFLGVFLLVQQTQIPYLAGGRRVLSR